MSRRPTKCNNRIVVDLNKVAYAVFYYRNQHGDEQALKPRQPTLFGKLLSKLGVLAIPAGAPPETLYERAVRLNRLDKWQPVLRLRLTCGDRLEYTGDKAKSLWKAWQEKQFGTK